MPQEDSITTTVRLAYPSQASYKCPVCNYCYSIYSSWTRHLTQVHPQANISIKFQCDDCSKSYDNKRSISTHYSKSHGKPAASSREGPDAGTLSCEFCQENFPSKRSVAQHIRNRHPEEASDKRAAQAANWEERYWSTGDHQLFLTALAQFGPSSNVKIAQYIGTKSNKQVALDKRIFLRNNPNWMQLNANPQSNSPTVPQPTLASTLSPDDSQSLPDLSPDHPPRTATAQSSLADVSVTSQSNLTTPPSSPSTHSAPGVDNLAPPPSVAAPLIGDSINNTPHSPSVPAVDNNSTITPTGKQDNWPDKLKEMTRKREERMQKFVEDSSQLTDRRLCEEEWSGDRSGRDCESSGLRVEARVGWGTVGELDCGLALSASNSDCSEGKSVCALQLACSILFQCIGQFWH